MTPRTSFFALALGMPALAFAIGAGDGGVPDEALRFNPFAIPDLGAASAAPSTGVSRDGWEPVLRATLVAEKGSLADLGGVLLAVGESHRGWELREVREFEAVFDRGGEEVVLVVTTRSERNSP